MAAKKRRVSKPSKGRNLTKPSKVKLAKAVCELYQTNRYTLEGCLKKVGIQSDATWYSWIDQIEEIKELYKEATEIKFENRKFALVAKARDAVERALDGYIVTLVHNEGEMSEGENGEIKTVKQKKQQVYIKPNLRAAEFLLTNLDGKNFSRNPEPYKAGNISYPDKIDVEIIGGVAPVKSEDDIVEPSI